MVRNTFPKSERIYLREEISMLFLSRRSFTCYPFRVLYAWVPYQEDAPVKVLISVPKKKLKHAVDRNRMKRLAKEAYRLNKHELHEELKSQESQEEQRTLLIGFIYLSGKRKSYARVHSAMTKALAVMSSSIQKQEDEGDL